MNESLPSLPTEEDVRVLELYRGTFLSGSGLQVLYHLIKTGGVFNTTFNKNAGHMAFNEGRRSIVLEIMSKVDSDTEGLRRRMLEAYENNIQ